MPKKGAGVSSPEQSKSHLSLPPFSRSNRDGLGSSHASRLPSAEDYESPESDPSECGSPVYAASPRDECVEEKIGENSDSPIDNSAEENPAVCDESGSPTGEASLPLFESGPLACESHTDGCEDQLPASQDEPAECADPVEPSGEYAADDYAALDDPADVFVKSEYLDGTVPGGVEAQRAALRAFKSWSAIDWSSVAWDAMDPVAVTAIYGITQEHAPSPSHRDAAPKVESYIDVSGMPHEDACKALEIDLDIYPELAELDPREARQFMDEEMVRKEKARAVLKKQSKKRNVQDEQGPKRQKGEEGAEDEDRLIKGKGRKWTKGAKVDGKFEGKGEGAADWSYVEVKGKAKDGKKGGKKGGKMIKIVNNLHPEGETSIRGPNYGTSKTYYPPQSQAASYGYGQWQTHPGSSVYYPPQNGPYYRPPTYPPPAYPSYLPPEEIRYPPPVDYTYPPAVPPYPPSYQPVYRS